MTKTTPKAQMKADAKAQAQAKTQAKKTRKKVITITLLSFLLIGIFSPLYQTIALADLEEGIYEVQDILAKDFDGIPRKHPQTYDEALEYYLTWASNGGKVEGRTGWSLKLFSCDNENMTVTADGQPTPWYEDVYAFTSDSGGDKIYSVEDYESQIRSKLVAKYGYSISKANLIIDEAKKRGVTLKYQDGSKRANEQDFPNGTYEDLPLPCNTGDVGFWYNDQDFNLEFSFEHTKEPEEIPTSCEPSLRVTPPSQTIKVGEVASYKAIYTDEKCVEHDVTNEPGSQWSIDDESIAKPVHQPMSDM